MSSYKTIKIDVDLPKARKLAAGKVVNLTASEVKGHDEVLHVHHCNFEKLMKAKRAGKGTRLQLSEGEVMADVALGGNIFKSIWKGVKDLWNPVLKPALSAALDTGSTALGTLSGNPALTTGVRQAIKQLTGVGMSCKYGKGTPEMKAHMSKIRGMRKGASMRGSSFRLN